MLSQKHQFDKSQPLRPVNMVIMKASIFNICDLTFYVDVE